VEVESPVAKQPERPDQRGVILVIFQLADGADDRCSSREPDLLSESAAAQFAIQTLEWRGVDATPHDGYAITVDSEGFEYARYVFRDCDESIDQRHAVDGRIDDVPGRAEIHVTMDDEADARQKQPYEEADQVRPRVVRIQDVDSVASAVEEYSWPSTDVDVRCRLQGRERAEALRSPVQLASRVGRQMSLDTPSQQALDQVERLLFSAPPGWLRIDQKNTHLGWLPTELGSEPEAADPVATRLRTK